METRHRSSLVSQKTVRSTHARRKTPDVRGDARLATKTHVRILSKSACTDSISKKAGLKRLVQRDSDIERERDGLPMNRSCARMKEIVATSGTEKRENGQRFDSQAMTVATRPGIRQDDIGTHQKRFKDTVESYAERGQAGAALRKRCKKGSKDVASTTWWYKLKKETRDKIPRCGHL
ncbi:hypothetical protein CPB85DRAFT_1452840 [Mucidula mucida]|nr:hypothetical protein CPB85DRAFT_1452840 [Mucidula mucida]